MGLAIDAYHNSALERLSEKVTEVEKANEKLKKVSAEKKQITDMIVHDLQNPLASIMAVFELLSAKAEGFSEPDREWLQKGLTRCGDLSQMIQNVVQVSRAEEGKLELQLEDINASEVARKSVEAFHLLAEQGGRLLKLEHAEDVPAMLHTDEGLFRRILDNLVRNALRHTPAGTEVNIRVHQDPTRITVCDNGPGIPPELQAKIFEPFTSRSVEGMGLDSGLGLSFCRLAAEALGLDLRLDSALGEGACFVIEAPER
jgi:signal transduction histidine kinase